MTSRRAGFTLIELLVVITIIGILASIALPKYSALKQRAYVTTMKSDLRNLLTAQEAFLAGTDNYANGVTSGPDRPGAGGRGRVSFNFSQDVRVIRVRRRSNRRRGLGWQAIIAHNQVRDRSTDRCGIYVGAD